MKVENPYRLVIVEDNKELRDILCEYIKANDKLFLADSYSNCEDALANLLQDKPRIVLMDIDLPGINGIEGTKRIKHLLPSAEVIIITVFENSETVFSALVAGAAGYLTKTLDREELMSSIDECLQGGAPMSMKIAKMVVGSFKKNTKTPLTERETEVLTHLSNGKSYNTIASLLNISKDTVKYHIKNIYIKLQVDSKEAAIEVANAKKFI
ncbi:MAG: response regulator transcription factor [Bacteroidetes bacterium]|nr:response regulator transcription factor [Bacteroidota bacterium]